MASHISKFLHLNATDHSQLYFYYSDNQAESNIDFNVWSKVLSRQSKVLGLTGYIMYNLYFTLVLENFHKDDIRQNDGQSHCDVVAI